MNSPEDAESRRLIVGWREFVALPDWGIPRVKAKIDTGARTSSLDVVDLTEMPGGKVLFHVVVQESPKLKLVEVEAPIIRISSVKPMPGQVEVRPVVSTTMELGGISREVEISLQRREGMLCRMLVGRLSLGDDFLVDPMRKYLLSDRPAHSRRSS